MPGYLPLTTLDMEESFRLNFYENLGTREFNLVEAAMVVSGFLHKCKMDSNQVREKILPLLGFQSGAAVLQKLHSLLRLIVPWKELVARDEIALPNAAKIAAFLPQEQKVLFEARSGETRCAARRIAGTARGPPEIPDGPWPLVSREGNIGASRHAQWRRLATHRPESSGQTIEPTDGGQPDRSGLLVVARIPPFAPR